MRSHHAIIPEMMSHRDVSLEGYDVFSVSSWIEFVRVLSHCSMKARCLCIPLDLWMGASSKVRIARLSSMISILLILLADRFLIALCKWLSLLRRLGSVSINCLLSSDFNSSCC